MDAAPTLPEALVAEEVRAICRRYRIDAEEARAILEESFGRRPDLLRDIAQRYPDEDVTRLAGYRKAVKEAKKQVYYRLRQYGRDAAERARLERRLEAGEAPEEVVRALLETHVSTKERASHYDAFYRALFERIDPPRRILDIGCGLHPLSYPYDAVTPRPALYVAMDRAGDVLDTLRRFAPHVLPTRLETVHADLADVRWDALEQTGDEKFEVAFALKVVPVVYRMQREAVGRIAEAPARRLVVTASAEALTRREDIRRREERILQAFVADFRLTVESRFEIPGEFGYVLTRE